MSLYWDIVYRLFDDIRQRFDTLRNEYSFINPTMGALVMVAGGWLATELGVLKNLFDFGFLQFVVYAMLWAILGGLPGYALFAMRNYNPQLGLRIGIVTGIGIGAALASVNNLSVSQIVSHAFVMAVVLSLVSFLRPDGTYRGQRPYGQRAADLLPVLVPGLLLLAAAGVLLGAWSILYDVGLITDGKLTTVEYDASNYTQFLDFVPLQTVLYLVLWAIIGGLPGFYIFYSRNHNPRVGGRMGLLTGVGLGVLFSGADSLQAQDIFDIALFLWLWAIVLSLFIPRGNHAETTSIRQRIADLAYGLLLPTFLVVIGIVVVPMLWNVLFAFRPIRLRTLQDVELLSLQDLTTDNFNHPDRGIFHSRKGPFSIWGAIGLSWDEVARFWKLLWVSLVYTFSGSILAIFMGLVAALIVKDRFPGRSVFRGILLFPYIAPIVAVTFIWQQMLDGTTVGFINQLLLDTEEFLNTDLALNVNLLDRRISYLREQEWALRSVIFFQGWRYFPFAFLFILARIQAIPDELYEAAKVDGAAPSQRLMFITLPQLRAVFGTLFLLRFIWTFNKFEDIFLLNGGAGDTEVVPIQIYEWLFSRQNVGASSAVALVMAAVLFLLVGIYFRWFLVEED
ncbi:MAG: sugar ABC transporter permease [Chloroflexi bacterium]|nr:sugar ABC transporter permease [Chloroflexota bacterium]